MLKKNMTGLIVKSPEAVIEDKVVVELGLVEQVAVLIPHDVAQDLLEVPPPAKWTVGHVPEIVQREVGDLPLERRRVDVLHPPAVLEGLPHVGRHVPRDLQLIEVSLSCHTTRYLCCSQISQGRHLSFPPDIEHDAGPVEVAEVEPETLVLVLSVVVSVLDVQADPQLQQVSPGLIHSPLLQSGRRHLAELGQVHVMGLQGLQQYLHHCSPVCPLLQDGTADSSLARGLELQPELGGLHRMADFADGHDVGVGVDVDVGVL